MVVERIINKPIDSNCYVIHQDKGSACLIVDPGTPDCSDLIFLLVNNQLIPEYIFLTHEHFDHIWGVNKLKETYNCKIVCSGKCAVKIRDRKKNMSVFYNQIGFEACPADIQVEELNYTMQWNGLSIEFIVSKGHTDAGICILINNNLFSGDQIIKGAKTVTKFPSGNPEELAESLSSVYKRFVNKQILVHPGHGQNFWLDEYPFLLT